MVVWQKFAGVVAMVRHLALFGSMQHSATSLCVLELQAALAPTAAQTSLALAASNSLPELAASHQPFLAVVSAPMVTHVALQHAVMSPAVLALQVPAAH